MPTSSDEQVFRVVQSAVSEMLRIPAERVAPDTKLGVDLGLESLDFVELQFRLETEFGVEFFPGSAIEKFEEVFDPDPLVVDGALTEVGARVLRLRLPEVGEEQLAPGQGIAGIESWYTLRTWARVVQEIERVRPSACAKCQSTSLSVSKPSFLRCDGCGEEIECPSGESCLTAWAEAARAQLAQAEASGTG